MNESSGPYNFSGRLSKSFPSQIIVDTTEVCNLACIHCPHPQFKQSKYYSAKYLDPVLNEKMVDEVRNHGQNVTQYIRYTSEGEPLVHPKGYDMVEYAVRKSGVFVTLTTNGTIMNEKRTKSLLDAGIHMIDISIDAFKPKTYSKIRVGGDLSVTKENVLRLLRWKNNTKSQVKIVVSFVEQDENKNESSQFKRYWQEQGVDSVVIRRLHSAAGAVKNVADDLHQKNSAVERRPCVYPWERIILNPRGHLSFCPADWTHGSTISDYFATSIKEIWNGKFYTGLRRAHHDNNYIQYEYCGQCPDWVQTRWPHEGRGYADLIEELLQVEMEENLQV